MAALLLQGLALVPRPVTHPLGQQLVSEASWSPRAELSLGRIMGHFLEQELAVGC